jgi:alkylation response protein AidB-like acyl-CoA dehydrogenase
VRELAVVVDDPAPAARWHSSDAEPTPTQRAAASWLRDQARKLADLPLPGGGGTGRRWRTLAALGATDLARARLAEGHVDARAILAELGAPARDPDRTWGVWAAEPARLRADRVPGGWQLVGEKGWCSGATALDAALVTATAPDGPRLFVVEPPRLEIVAGSWPSGAMAATASYTLRFDVAVPDEAALGGPDAYVRRAGFWHGGAGVAACWFGGALGISERLRTTAAASPDARVVTAWGRVRARLEATGALLARSASRIDAAPDDIEAARRRALRLRLVVEDAASFTLGESITALGAGALAYDRDYARRVADLQLYLRQLRPDATAHELGTATTLEPVRW